ncbi:MAG: AbrB/MazE/SpoVT family DNA-binding domain-containing protein [Syntrophomonadaceae bacterium]|nr:AbrB/MazE/SpoVT family DNA-binding domain-containing protein [Syntrophomonadaceae bacterium]
MKATGVVRKIDQLGRIVIPKEVRTAMAMGENDPIEFFVADNQVILQRYEPGCIFCGSGERVLRHKGLRVCARCMSEMSRKSAQQ